MTEVPYENIKFNPEEKGENFSTYLQGDLMRTVGLEGNKRGQLEWVLKNRLKFREIVDTHPELKEIYLNDQTAGIELAKKLMNEKEGVFDKKLDDELPNKELIN